MSSPVSSCPPSLTTTLSVLLHMAWAVGKAGLSPTEEEMCTPDPTPERLLLQGHGWVQGARKELVQHRGARTLARWPEVFYMLGKGVPLSSTMQDDLGLFFYTDHYLNLMAESSSSGSISQLNRLSLQEVLRGWAECGRELWSLELRHSKLRPSSI